MFKDVDIYGLNESAVRLVGEDWMLITAGTKDHYNTMTAAWGGLGVLWKKPTAYIFVRPTRFTYEFTEKYEYFSLSFFEEKYKNALQLCGTRSGRDIDKAKETGLVPVMFEDKTTFFEQARLVLICRKNYYHDLDPSKFLDPATEKNYPLKDYHRLYFGEIVKSLMRES